MTWSNFLIFIFMFIWCFMNVVECYPVTCKPAYIYADHMVLQRKPHGAVLWGYTDQGFSVNVTFKGVNHVSKGMPGAFGPDMGVWKVVLPPQPAGGPFTIDITCFDGQGNWSNIQLQDILFGDVWICSGQSNMAMAVRQAMNATAELAASVNYPNVRVLSVKQAESYTPYYDFNSTSSLYHPWAKADPESLGANAIGNYTYFSAVCWFYGRDLYDTYKVPVGIISTNWGATPVEAWSSPDVINSCAESVKKANVTKSRCASETVKNPIEVQYFKNDSVLWNAMIYPFVNMTIKGAIWSQGESNARDPDTYRCHFQAMISDWRQKWYAGSSQQTNPLFPFGFVQIGTSWLPQLGVLRDRYPVNYYKNIRWHQTNDVGYVPNAGMPNVFMAVAIDLTDFESPWNPIHPRYKQDVAARLVQAARVVAYQEKGLIYQGPFPTKFVVDSQAGTIKVQYKNKGSEPVRLVGPRNNTFEVCCSNCTVCQDGDTWIGTTGIAVTGLHSIRMNYTCKDLDPVAMRYLWRDYPCTYKKCLVYNKDSFLPAPPFVLPLDYTFNSAVHYGGLKFLICFCHVILFVCFYFPLGIY
ncbi:sialate O-acetylesterase-like [Amphiura filiformis]|uniref:sialate O-acetylesterase-like n=1 Tax=Amphiura filiformis TaxID=82378 RepID=UPI003B22149C